MIMPGQSLTAEPKNAPYENPPEMSNPEDAVMWHLERLSKGDKQENLLDAMELDIDVVTLTEGILRGAVLEGRHSVDVSLLIAPVLHEYIKTTADKAGIDYNEGFPDDSKERRAIKYSINKNKASKILASFKKDGKVESAEMDAAPSTTPKEIPTEMMEPDAAPSSGLMSRPVKGAV